MSEEAAPAKGTIAKVIRDPHWWFKEVVLALIIGGLLAAGTVLGQLEEVLVTLLVFGGKYDSRSFFVDIMFKVTVMPAFAHFAGSGLHNIRG